ncbi:MAG: hypothetical protein NUV88_01690 [Candidatus Kaiserbacteria bacterium]|nr:hypothetical protein [Candidatus Kaiserbacteria bacterium]
MYELKDTKDADQFSRSLDGHVVRTNPFGRNASGDKAYRRAERLVAGLHLLTSHVSPEEPVRQIVRKKSVQLLSNILDLRDEMRGASSVKTRTVQASIRELISLVRVLTISGFISFQNADVVIESLDELGNFLHASRRSSLSEDIVLSREDLLGVQPVIQKKKAMTVTRTIGILSDKELEAGTISDIKDNTNDGASKDNRTDTVTARGQNILEVLGSGGEMGIKDVCAHFPEYSEKMVQRELASLVSAKKVKKTGLKRWSRYSLVQ